MWYEILPCYMIITACIALPPVAAYYIQKFTQNGNPYRRFLFPDHNRDLYLRDLRLSGKPYVIQGLEKIRDRGDNEDESEESDQIKKSAPEKDGEETENGKIITCLPSEERSKVKLPESLPIEAPPASEEQVPVTPVEQEPVNEPLTQKTETDNNIIVSTSAQQSLGKEEETPEKHITETTEREPEEKKKKKKKKKKKIVDQPID